MVIVGCPICSTKMDKVHYREHLSRKHPEFQPDWFPSKEIQTNRGYVPKRKDWPIDFVVVAYLIIGCIMVLYSMGKLITWVFK